MHRTWLAANCSPSVMASTLNNVAHLVGTLDAFEAISDERVLSLSIWIALAPIG